MAYRMRRYSCMLHLHPMPKKAYKRTVRRNSKNPSLQTCLNHAAELVNGSERSSSDDDEGGSSGCFTELPRSPGRPPKELPSPLLVLLPVSRAADSSRLEEYGEPDIGLAIDVYGNEQFGDGCLKPTAAGRFLWPHIPAWLIPAWHWAFDPKASHQTQCGQGRYVRIREEERGSGQVKAAVKRMQAGSC